MSSNCASLQAWCLSITFGYFVYDTIGVYLIEHDWDNSFHHFASMLAFYIGIFRGISGSELAWSLFLMEISNPLLHLRSYMKVKNFWKIVSALSDTAACNCNEALMLSLEMPHKVLKVICHEPMYSTSMWPLYRRWVNYVLGHIVLGWDGTPGVWHKMLWSLNMHWYFVQLQLATYFDRRMV